MTVGDVLLNVDVLIFYSAAMFWENVLFMHTWWFIGEVTSRLWIRSYR